MHDVLPKILLAATGLLPAVILIPQIHLQRRKARRRSKAPFTELLLRPAGESLRLKLKQMEDKLVDYLFNAIAYPILFGGVALVTLSAQQLEPSLLMLAVLAVAVGATYFCWGRHISPLRRAIRDHELGFQGERYVGEELNQLLKQGFRVYHDLPFDTFNIDHVIVGPPGVYAIETKTRRKPIGDKGKASHKITFDGTRLLFPRGWDTHGLEQAKRNADHLASWLSSATAEKVKVEAILTFPGWWIDRTGRGAVHVVNTKEIPKIFAGKPASLSPEQIQRISHQIEQKCRNMEV